MFGNSEIITPISQENPFGCGVACVAFIVGDSYKNVLKLFNNPDNAVDKGYYCKDLIFVLNQYGLKYRYRKFNGKQTNIRDNTIVYTKKSIKYPAGHYLVKTSSGWMNSWSNFPNTPIQSTFQKSLIDEIEYIVYKDN